MNDENRRITESPLYQGEDERIAYTLTTTPWASDPTSPVVTVKDSGGTDVTADVTSGSASVTGDVITTPIICDLTAAAQYRLEIKFTSADNVLEAWADLRGEA